ncbi:MAG: hypothetical protein AAFO94_05815 [Bacteroidota bacterium]
MQKIEVLLSMLILLTFGYSEVKFEESQPRELQELNEFPEELVGEYVNVDGHLTKVSKEKMETELFTADLTGQRQGVQLKRYKDYFFLNAQVGEEWELLLIEQKGEGMLQLKTMGELSEDEVYLLSNLTLTRAEDANSITINPAIQELERLIENDFFDEVVRMKKLDLG